MLPTLPTLLDASARRRPKATALVWHDVRWSYADLAAASAAAAAFLERRGAKPGDRVGLLLRNCPQYVALYYGALAAGCAVVPLNPHERAQVLAMQAQHCGTSLLVGDTAHPEWNALARKSREAGVGIIPIEVADDAAALQGYLDQLKVASATAGPRPPHTAAADELATIIYTSGTTGRPKGVMLSHGNLAANTASIVEYLELGPADRVLTVLPFQFSYGNSVLHTHLAVGAEVLLEDSLAYPHAVLQRMQDEAVSGFSGVPSTFALLLSRCNLEDYDLGALRYLTQAGGPMPRANIARLREKLPKTRLFIMYGQTEAAARLSYLPPERLDDKLGSVGRGIPGVELAVLHPDGSRAGAGETGEICARGANIMLGYWNDPASSREVLRDGWLLTGDLGHFDQEGFLYIDGRAVEMIKVGAFRVSPQEVEEVIAALPGVEEVGVTAVKDEMLGQAVKAVIVVRAGASLDERTVKAHCHRNLAAYKIPKQVEFAAVLPHTATGKVQRLRLV